MGKMLFVNIIVAIFAMVGGILFVKHFVQNQWLEYDEKLKIEAALSKDLIKEKLHDGNIYFDILPIVFPILLIGSGAFIDFKTYGTIGSILHFCTLPLIAVFIGAFIAIFQLSSSNKRNTINRLVEQAIIKSALVIMITGAGGSLGYVIKQSGIQNEIVDVFSYYPFLGIVLPFIVAAILTTSTGSITVSLVGTASMIGPMADILPISPEMTAAMIGSGAFCVFHANSSFFWLLNKLHDVPPKILYKTYTLQSLVMGVSGLLGALILMMFGF